MLSQLIVGLPRVPFDTGYYYSIFVFGGLVWLVSGEAFPLAPTFSLPAALILLHEAPLIPVH